MSVNVALPNGTVVCCLQKHDVPLVWLEVESYFSNGLRLRPGDTVFDVGANIGLFSLAAYERCGHKLRVFAFEPVEEICHVLRENLKRCAEAQVKTFSLGLASRSERLPFAYYPHAPVLSTAYPDEEADLEMVKDAVLNSIIHLDEAPLAVRFLRWIPGKLRAAILQFALRRTLRPRTVTCEMSTLSDIVRDHRVERIDVLKIDVEKAELDVLRGVEATDWNKIQQIIVDVHDLNNRLATVKTLLRDRGFTKIMAEQPPTLRHSNIYTVFATRKPLPSTS